MKFYPPGARIAGRYEVASRPLIGGMGIVYVCLDHEADRPVALKTFRPEFLPDRAARDRFLREGTTWMDLGRHPHIVHAYGVERIGDGQEVYLVLELVAKEQGRQDAALRSWLVPGRPLPVEQALLFALQIARGMAHATATIPGFVHRDLKPENVLVGADRLPSMGVNRLRVTDFGLAAMLEDSGIQPPEVSETLEVSGLGRTQLTQGIVGTPLYMAPEQWRGEGVCIQTDVYALGCILYEMLAGQRAVEGHSLAALERAHCEGELRSLPAGLPGAVGEVVARCLAVEPTARYAGWEEVEEALAAAYAGATGRAAPGPELAQMLSRAERIAMGWSYSEMGLSYWDIGKAEVALGYFERARNVGQAEAERGLEAAGLAHLGLAYAHLGNARRAIRFCEEALTIWREIGDRHGEKTDLGNLGNAYIQLGDPRRAIGFYEQALTIAREIGDRHGEKTDLGNLGNAHIQLGDPRRAIGFYKQALAIAREIGDRRGEGAALGNFGMAYATLGEARQAVGFFEQALTIACETGDRHGKVNALGNLGNAYTDLREIRRAIGFYEQALTIWREIGDRRGEGATLDNLGNAYARLGELQRAVEYHEQALAIDREIGDRHGEGATLCNLGSAYADLRDTQRAIEYWRQASAILEEIGDVMNVASIGFNLALLLTRQRRHAEALPYAKRAAQVFAQIAHAQKAQQAQRLVAQIRAAMR